MRGQKKKSATRLKNSLDRFCFDYLDFGLAVRFRVEGLKGNQKITIFLRGSSKEMAMQKAVNKGIYPLSIVECPYSGFFASSFVGRVVGFGVDFWRNIFAEVLLVFRPFASSGAKGISNQSFANLFTRPISPLSISQDLALLSIMLESALPLQDAFLSLSATTPSPTLAQMYRKILLSLQNGESLSEAISPFEKIFTPMGVALLQAGIKGGKLPSILQILSEYFHHIATTRQNLTKALFYPAFVLLSTILAFVFIAYFVIPEFSELFLSFGVELPFSSKSLIFASQILQDFGVYMLLFVCLAVAFVAQGMRAKNHIYFALHRYILDAPLMGKIVLYRDLWVYFLSFLHLYEAGVDFDTTLKVAPNAIQNPHLKHELSLALTRVKNGKNIYEAFSPCPHIESNIKHFLSIAQQSGELAKMLNLCTKYYKNRYEQLSAKILAYIEPFSTIIIALLVAWLAFGIFLPIWELGSVGF